MPPAPITLGQLNHIALPTNDPARAEKFYVDLLGFRVVPRPSFSFDGRWLYREDVGPMLHLLHVPDHCIPTGPINTLSAHLAIQCGNAQEVVDQLNVEKIEYVERHLPDFGYRQIFFRDPDGNLIELGEWPELKAMVKQHELRAQQQS